MKKYIMLVALLVGCATPNLEPPPFRPRCLPIPPEVSPLPPIEQWSPSMNGLIDGGNQFEGARVQKSEPHKILVEAAEAHAQYQASVDVQGHQRWEYRRQELATVLPGYHFTEIAAESWPWQVNDSMSALGYEMFNCWSQSSGHWSVASKKHKFWGGAMAKSRSGIWYACIIVAN